MSSPPLIVSRDKEAISSHRPTQYVEKEHSEVRRNSSIVPAQAEKVARKIRLENEGEKLGGGHGNEEGDDGQGVELVEDV